MDIELDTIDEDFSLSNAETALLLLHDLWTLFYAWEQNYCTHTAFSSLAASSQHHHHSPPPLPPPRIGATFAAAEALEDGYWETEDVHFDAPVRVPCQPIAVQQRHSTANNASNSGAGPKVVPLEAYPAYTSCTPASRNTLVGADELRSLRAPFAPFADDPAFDVIAYLRDFEDFAWQNDHEDPDYAIILGEWARQLYFNHNFSLDELDSLLFDFTGLSLRSSSRSGLLWELSQRDYPTWAWPRPDIHAAFPPFYPHLQSTERARVRAEHDPDPDHTPPTDAVDDTGTSPTLLSHLLKDAPHTCANTNCMLLFCPHVRAHPRPLLPTRGARAWDEHIHYLASEAAEAQQQQQRTGGGGGTRGRKKKKRQETDMRARQRKDFAKWETRRAPCGGECWMTVKDGMIGGRDGLLALTNNWDPAETAEIHQLMRLAGADGGPCDWAVICRKSCAELYAERARIYPTDPIVTADPDQMDVDAAPGPTLPAAWAPNASLDGFIEDTDPTDLDVRKTLDFPCSHTGPCSPQTNCSCFKSQQRCTRACRCLKACELRYTGCTCTSKKMSCHDPAKCRCKQIGRECDPELCRGCGKSSTSCQHMGVQKKKFRDLQIKKGKCGLGAFALDTIPFGNLIGEYVGEVMRDQETYLTRIQEHTHLNYMFTLSKERRTPKLQCFLIDAWAVGNETRYLNHSKNANCIAVFIYVNGEYKILIRGESNPPERKIRRGEELTLDYGDYYWTNTVPIEDDDVDLGTSGMRALTLSEERGHRLAEAADSDFEMAQRRASDTETLEYADANDADIDEGTP